MKWLAIFLTLAWAAPAWSEETQKLELEEQIDVAKAQLGAGVALTAVAVILGATSAGLFIADHGVDESIAHKGGLGLGISAGVLGIVGLPLAIVGGPRLRDLKKRELAIGASSVKLSF